MTELRTPGLGTRGSGLEEPTDAALDREIGGALAVEPSHEFVARVRARVAHDAVSRVDVRLIRWALMGGASLATIGIATAVYFGLTPFQNEQSAGAAPGMARVEPARANGRRDQVPIRSDVPTAVEAREPGEARHVSAAPRPVVTGQVERETFPEVMVSASEAEGMRQLLALSRTGIQIVEGPEAHSASEPEQMPDIAIKPITIAPIALARMEGVAE